MKRSQVANFIKTLRQELNMTQGDMSKYFGVNPATISKWELGAYPREESFALITKVHDNPIEFYKFYNLIPTCTKEETLPLSIDKNLIKKQIESLQKQLNKLELEELIKKDEAFTVIVEYELRDLVYEYVNRECTSLTRYVNHLIREHMDKKVTS